MSKSIRAFVVDAATGQPRSNVPVAFASVGYSADQTETLTLISVRQSDRSGFVSLHVMPDESPTVIQMYPLAEPSLYERFGPFDKFTDLGVLPVPSTVPSVPTGTFPTGSCGNPGDAEVSPSSFAARGQVEGQSDCDLFLPGSQAERVYTFRQLVTRPNLPEQLEYFSGLCFAHEDLDGSPVPRENNRDFPPAPCYTRAVLLEYSVTWCALGHALGEIAYSLPLAPCESVRLAVVDWQRDDLAVRTENTEQRETLNHEQQRDRVVDETVNASLKESQRGFSVTGGVSLGGLVSVGGGYSSSTGERDLHSKNTQSLADSIQQASTSMRGLYSTVIVQASQSETDSATTRIVTNNNHCHAMTILYYEVLRRYLVKTEVGRERELILVQFPVPDFDSESALCHRWLLEPALLEKRLSASFESVVSVRYRNAPPDPSEFTIPALPVRSVTGLKVIITTGDNPTDADVFFSLYRGDRTRILREGLDRPGGDFEEGQEGEYDIPIVSDWSPNDVFFVEVQIREGALETDWQLARVQVLYQAGPGTTWHDLYDSNEDEQSTLPKTLAGNGRWQRRIPRPEPIGVTPEEERARMAVSELAEDLAQSRRLLEHLNCNKDYYWRIIWENEDPGRRANWLAELNYKGRRLLDAIENRVIAVVGNSLAFPLQENFDGTLEEEPNDFLGPAKPVSRLIDLPTRGLFAEAKLSNCNVCEEKDVTRYWDWTESPCPCEAPEIAPVPLGSRSSTTDTSPSGFASPIVNIANPSPAPDPTGLASALSAFARPDLFRDMSNSEAITELLSDLTAGAIDLEEARARANRISDSSGRASDGSTRRSTAGAHDSIQVVRNARDNGEISSERADELVAEILEQHSAEADVTNPPFVEKGSPTSREREWYTENPSPMVDTVESENQYIIYLWNFEIDGSDFTLQHGGLLKRFLDEVFGLEFLGRPARFLVEGHASSSGPERNNIRLSEERTLNVINWLTGYRDGVVSREYIEGFSYGSSAPVVPEISPEDAARNRSVQVTLFRPPRIERPELPESEKAAACASAITYIEARLGVSGLVDCDSLWTATASGIYRLFPKHPANITRPSHYGDSVPPRPISSTPPLYENMPRPRGAAYTYRILGEQLAARYRLDGTLTDESARQVAEQFVGTGENAIHAEGEARAAFRSALRAAGGASIDALIDAENRYDEAKMAWFEHNTCLMKHLY